LQFKYFIYCFCINIKNIINIIIIYYGKYYKYCFDSMFVLRINFHMIATFLFSCFIKNIKELIDEWNLLNNIMEHTIPSDILDDLSR